MKSCSSLGPKSETARFNERKNLLRNEDPMNARFQELAAHEDSRGALVAIEGMSTLPFTINRAYYIFGTAGGVRRGAHAHKSLQQLMIAVSGSCTVLIDDGTEKKEFVLDIPRRGLYVGPGNWREMYDFSPGCVLLVLASEHYTESDYIRDYDDFITYVKSQKSNSTK
jgi:dTDP-4-dehydrorhamnose 3,5-epimerase-like enzyme